MTDEKRSSTELANKLQHEFFDSLVIESILKCHNTTEIVPDILKKEVADLTFTDNETHQVTNSDLHEEAKNNDTEQYRKISLKASNVPSEFNLTHVSISFLNIFCELMTNILYRLFLMLCVVVCIFTKNRVRLFFRAQKKTNKLKISMTI